MDRHLNAFYTYNHSNELIENNLTRAFMVTMTGMSSVTRNFFLHKLHQSFQRFDFNSARFALQNMIESRSSGFRYKHIVTISTDFACYGENEFNSMEQSLIGRTLISKRCPQDVEPEIKKYLDQLCGGSIPDAWIYDSDGQYCFLIECKKNNDVINYAQILRHAYENFGFSNPGDIKQCLVRLTWDEILNALINIPSFGGYQNKQEEFLVSSLVQYMGFFGYTYFRGFNFSGLLQPPEFERFNNSFFNFMKLAPPPQLKMLDPSEG